MSGVHLSKDLKQVKLMQQNQDHQLMEPLFVTFQTERRKQRFQRFTFLKDVKTSCLEDAMWYIGCFFSIMKIY